MHRVLCLLDHSVDIGQFADDLTSLKHTYVETENGSKKRNAETRIEEEKDMMCRYLKRSVTEKKVGRL